MTASMNLEGCTYLNGKCIIKIWNKYPTFKFSGKMIPNLSNGAIESLITGGIYEKPVLQLLGVKKLDGVEVRYRLLLSDGEKSNSSALLAPQLNKLIDDGDLEKYSVIRIEKKVCNNIPKNANNNISQDRRVLVILDLTVLVPGSQVKVIIGNPKQYKQVNTEPTENLNNVIPKITLNNFTEKNNYSQMSKQSNPINSLTPYQNRWTIKARVSNKSNIRTWSNSRGEGKLFSMDLLDESGEIRVTAFNEQCDQFYPIIEIGKVYYISKATLKTANKAFTTIKNDYEITLNAESTIIPCYDESDNIPVLQYNFIPINELVNFDKDQLLDVMGVIRTINEPQTIVSRNFNKEIVKREISIMDQTLTSVTLTLWGPDAQNFKVPNPGETNNVIVVKSARLSDFNGRSLSMIQSSSFQINPDLPESYKLRGWYDHEGKNVTGNVSNISEAGMGGSSNAGVGAPANWKCLSQIKSENMGHSDKPDYLSAKATVVFFKKENCLYQACPSPDCNKKVVDLNNGKYRCEKCQKDHDNFQWRMILSVNISDFSNSQWVMAFQEVGETLLGVSADTLGDLKSNDSTKFDEVFKQATFKSYVFKLRAKNETFNDESRLKVSCLTAQSVNFKEYNKKLIDEIKAMM